MVQGKVSWPNLGHKLCLEEASADGGHKPTSKIVKDAQNAAAGKAGSGKGPGGSK